MTPPATDNDFKTFRTLPSSLLAKHFGNRVNILSLQSVLFVDFFS